jgi:hypothetical protein
VSNSYDSPITRNLINLDYGKQQVQRSIFFTDFAPTPKKAMDYMKLESETPQGVLKRWEPNNQSWKVTSQKNGHHIHTAAKT